MKRRKPKVKLWTVVSEAVAEGAVFGVSRAYKHTDQPDRETLIANIEREVMNSLCEVIDFE